MDSPEQADRIKAPSSSTPTSSPTVPVPESPIFDYLSNLSPIKSVKAARYQRFFETHFPTPPPVFRTPRLDLQRETSFLKSDKIDEAGSDVHGKCGNRANAFLIPCLESLEKEVQSCSPSGCVDEYLTDPVEVEDCKNSAGSHVRQPNNLNRLLQFSYTVPKETIPKVNDGNSEDCKIMLPDPAKPMDLIETAVDERDTERFDGPLELTSKTVNDQVESNLLLVSRTQHYEQYLAQISRNVKLQNAGDQLNQQSSNCQFPKSFQSVESYKDCLENSGSASEGSSKDATLQQRGTRRHLQFEAAMTCKSTEEENLIPSHVEPRGVSNRRHSMSSDQAIASWTSLCPSEFIRSTQHGGTLAISGSIPSGAGLHRNSISRSLSMDSDRVLSKKFGGYMSSQEEKLTPGHSNNLAKSLNSCFISSAEGELHVRVDSNQQDDHGVEEISSDIFQSSDSMKPPCNYLHAAFSEQQADPSEGGMHTSESIDRAEELNQMSPKKKRKRAALSSESEGCKRCNCRRSKCLKLYCECFAAGVYCVDSCACESCYNKPEYEDTVLDTRQQIESRNPLAFAPKIVKHATDSPANVLDDGNWTTPASARHKRGCNCKKSKCLKKYCECYQAKVGCSDACRCEGCNNSFGKKAGSMYQRAERWKNPSHCKLDATETDIDRTEAGTVTQFSPRWEEFADISNLTPLSHYSGALAPSVSPSTRDCPKVSQAQLHPGSSSLKSSANHLRWHYSPMSFTPQLIENKEAHHKLDSDNAFTEIRTYDDIPEMLKNTSTPTKEIKACSPNKKRVSPPQFPSQELMSSSSSGMQSVRKFVWQTVPSFPPLTPYSKSNEGITQTESDLKRNTSDH
ncbi:hypothetical protein Dsin_013522 [Dipteronia sinensis]|uniref:CRC domain-containing protein n=1 Tax=Dipteronia sinensis TaxID=43782 RepID=A0AAE0ALA1_9ROSI|nr:hypothetical protein Dsin_013522 [Dipteronia sinensis]